MNPPWGARFYVSDGYTFCVGSDALAWAPGDSDQAKIDAAFAWLRVRGLPTVTGYYAPCEGWVSFSALGFRTILPRAA